MLAQALPDELDPTDVARLDRAELISRIQELERERSAWELRIRACQERESLSLKFVADLAQHIVTAYENIHMEISSHAAQTAELMEIINMVQKKVEVI